MRTSCSPASRPGICSNRVDLRILAGCAEGDDIVLDGVRLPMLRQQADFGDSRPNRALADYVAPPDSGLDDHVGAFAVAIHGADELATVYPPGTTTIERSRSRRSRTDSQKRSPSGSTSGLAGMVTRPSASRIRSGARAVSRHPARLWYPACPDHWDKRTLFALLEAGRAGLALTETCAMTPAAAVSGNFIGHPSARYFSIGRVGRDQLGDYAARKEMALQEAERWLPPILRTIRDALSRHGLGSSPWTRPRRYRRAVRRTALLLLAALAAGCGGMSPEDVVRQWSDALNHGLNDDAAVLFAPGAEAVSAEGEVIVLRSQRHASVSTPPSRARVRSSPFRGKGRR